MSSRVVPVLLVVLLVGIGVVAFVVNMGGDGEPEDPETPVATTTPESPGGTVSPDPVACATEPVAVETELEFTRFSSEEAGVTVSYPEAWESFEGADEEVLFGAVARSNLCDSMLLRLVELPQSVEDTELEDLRQFTDQLLTGTSIRLLGETPQQVEVGGLPGWNYLYRFEDQQTGQVGIHSHYFLFRGDEMITLVFQALPAEGFEALAPVFDRIQQSFESVGAGQQTTPAPQ